MKTKILFCGNQWGAFDAVDNKREEIESSEEFNNICMKYESKIIKVPYTPSIGMVIYIESFSHYFNLTDEELLIINYFGIYQITSIGMDGELLRLWIDPCE